MSAITFEQLSKLVYDNISAQAKRDAEQAKRDADRDAEMKKIFAGMAKLDAKYNDKMAKLDAKYNDKMAKRAKREDEGFKQLRQQLGWLGNSYGEQVEAMFVNLGDKFNALGYCFPKEAEGRVKFLDENRKVLVEVDRLLENGEAVLPVEIKAKLNIGDVNDHIERLRKIRMYNLKHNDNRKVLGAVGGGVVSQEVKEYAVKKGLFVLEQNGSSIEISDVSTCFKPTEW